MTFKVKDGISIAGTTFVDGSRNITIGTLNGNTPIHSGNYSSYAAPSSHTHDYLPLSGGTVSGTVTANYFQGGGWGVHLNPSTAAIRGNGGYGGALALVDGSYGIALWSQVGTLHFGFGSNTSVTAKATMDTNGNFNVAGALTQASNQVLHAGNVSSYALPIGGGTISGPTYISTGGNYPLQLISTQRYMLQIRNSNNSVNSGYGWWFATDTNFNFAMHADGLGDVLTLTRSGALTLNGNTALHAGNYSSYALPLAGGTLTGDLNLVGGRVTASSGGTNTYGIFSGYANNNHFIGLRCVVTGSTTSPTFTGNHQTTLVEYAEANDSTGWFFKSSQSGSYVEVARITRSQMNWNGNTVLHAGNVSSYAHTISSDPSTAGPGTLAIGNNGSYSFVQSHAGQPLNLNPVGNPVNITGNTAIHAGNYSSYALPLSGGGLTGNLGVLRKRLTFSSISSDANHSIYNNYDNIDGEGSFDGMKMNVYAGLRVRVGNASGAVPTQIFSLDSSGVRLGNGTSSPASTAFSHTLAGIGTNRVVNFDGNGNGSPSVWWTNGSRALAAIDAKDPGLTFWANNGSGWQQQMELNYGSVNINTTLTQGGNQVLHAGNINSYIPSWSTGVNGGHLVQRDGNGYIYANHVNFNTGIENPTIDNFITGNGDGWSRKSSLAHVKNSIRGIADGTWGISISGSAAQLGGVAASDYFTSAGSYPNEDMNTPVEGFWHVRDSATGKPEVYYGHRWDYDHLNNGQWVVQMYSPTGGDAGLWFRQRRNYEWQTWRKFLDSSNYSSYALPLSGGTLSGGLTVNNATINVPSGYVSNGNPWGTSNSAFFPNGITTNNATNWIYGYCYLGNAPSNGSGAEVQANGRFHNTVSSGTAMHVRRTGSGGSATNSYTALFEQTWGDHSWGIVAEFRAGGSGGSDRPSILFSNGYNSTTWSVGYGAADDQFRINQNHGHRNSGWGSERFRIDTGSTAYFNGNVAIHAANVSSYALPIGGGTLTSSTKIKAGHGDTRFQLHYNHDNADTTSGYAGYLTLWASEPGLSYAYTGIGGNINIGGNYYGRQTSGQAYGLYLRFETASGFSEFWATTGAVGSAGGQGSRVAYIDAAGNSVFSGNVTAYSDERLKKDWVALPADFIARLATVKSGTYTRVDSGARQAGSSAQDWKTLLPEVVSASNDEAQTLSLAYGNAALVSAVELAKEVIDLRAQVTELRALIITLINKDLS